MATTICHWNLQGFSTHYPHLRTLLAHSNAVVTCLQETRLPNPPPSPPRGFHMYHTCGPPGMDGLDHGGACVLVKSTIGHLIHPLTTDLQAVAIRCHLDRLYTICSLYLPPASPVSIDQLLALVQQLPPPFLLLGDFNARHHLWGDTVTTPRGRIIESLLAEGDCGILNDGTPTHFHAATSSFSSIDLSICSPLALPDFTWSVARDLYGSDHFPVLLTLQDPSPIASSPRFNYDRADWGRFAAAAVCDGTASNFPSVDAAVDCFHTVVLAAASTAIPTTSGIIRTPPVPWWSAELQAAHREKRAALRRFQHSRLLQDKVAFCRARAVFRHLQTQSRTQSWQHYVSSLTSRTPLSKVWQRVKKIQGRYGSMSRPVLQDDTDLLTNPLDVANCFGRSLSNISAGLQSPTFLAHKRRVEASPVLFPDDDGSDYNVPITRAEFDDALKQCSNTAAGEDGIHYRMLKHLPDVSTCFLLSLFNRIWSEDSFPHQWQTAIVLPFLKAGKNPLVPSNYRPIALTSCLCKLLEKIINSRLIWFLESHSILHPTQYGFRKCRSTTDALVRLDSFIKSAFARKEHVLAVFFDMQKAYDTTWKHPILQTLYSTGCTGHLPRFLQNFLTNRLLKVRVGTTLSDSFPQAEGVPQGSVLSCSLFALAINALPTCLPPSVECSLYVDDFVIFTKSAHLPSAERRLQLAVKKAHSWTQQHGFQFSPDKTVSMHFTRLRGVFPPLSLALGTSVIHHVTDTTFLGLTLDSKLSYIPHLKRLRTRCLQALQLLQCLSHLKWGADRSTLLHIYRALVRSRLDYACQVYASANKTALGMLDPIHHRALRLATGAFRSSPVVSLYAETGEPSLSHRRDKLSLQLYVRLLGMPGTPAFEAVSSGHYDHYFLHNQRLHSTFGFRMRQLLQGLHVDQPHVMRSLTYHSPPHTLPVPHLCDGIMSTNKSSMPPSALRNLCVRHIALHENLLPVYTDGSKSADGVGYAALFHDRTLSGRLPPAASIFTAELRAILPAVAYMMRLHTHTFVLYSDSKSALQSICNPFSPHPLVREVHRWLRMLYSRGNQLTFCWVPAHVGVAGNEAADREAQAVVQRTNHVTPVPLPYRDFYPYFASLLRDRWLSSWRDITVNKLRAIKGTVSVWGTSCRRNRYHEIILARLRLGHTRLTHGHLMSGDPLPYCEGCIVPLTVSHILAECPEYLVQRRMCFGSDGVSTPVSLNNILRDDEAAVSRLFDFLQMTDLLREL